MRTSLRPAWVRTAAGLTLLAASSPSQATADQPGRLSAEARAAITRSLGSHIQTAQLWASNGGLGDVFGNRVAISGNTIVVGAPQADIGGNVVQGAAYVFLEPEGGWVDATQVARLTASDGQSSDFFGSSVSINGNTIVVGADQDRLFTPGRGAAYVFVRSQSGWFDSTETAKLTASDAAAGDDFGTSTAIGPNTIVIGADQTAGGTTGGPGKAYVFVKPQGGWVSATETAVLTASTAAWGDSFGGSVALDGSAIVVGAPNAGVGGAAYLFVRPATGWVSSNETAMLTPSDGTPDNLFGQSVCLRGDTLVVGAPDAPIGSITNPGAAYVFSKPVSGWVSGAETAKLSATSGERTFGEAVGISGGTAVVGAPSAKPCPFAGGAVYAFVKPPGSWVNGTETDGFFAADGADGDFFGASVAMAGDTLVVGAPKSTLGGTSAHGAAYVFDTPYLVAPPAPPPTLTAVVPATVTNFTLPQSITLTGTKLDCVDTVTVGGTAFAIQSQGPTFLSLQVPFGHPIGTHSVAVTGGSGASNAIPFEVAPSHPSLLSAPVNHVLGTTRTYRTFTDAGWASLYLLSPVQGTTALPGVVTFDIGGGLFGNLVRVITITADGGGIADLPVTMPAALFPPFTLYWECLTFDPSVALGLQAPLETSNTAEVSTLF